MIKMNKTNEAYEMTKKIADSTREQRHVMLTERLKMISVQPEEERTQSVMGMVMGMSKLDAKRRSIFQCSLAEALTERSSEERHAIYVGRAKAGQLVPKEIDTTIYQGIVDEIHTWPTERRQKIIGDIENAYDSLNLTRPDFTKMLKKAAA